MSFSIKYIKKVKSSNSYLDTIFLPIARRRPTGQMFERRPAKTDAHNLYTGRKKNRDRHCLVLARKAKVFPVLWRQSLLAAYAVFCLSLFHSECICQRVSAGEFPAPPAVVCQLPYNSSNISPALNRCSTWMRKKCFTIH